MQVLLSRTAQAGARRHFAGANRRCALCSMLQVVRDWFNAPWLNHCSCHICWNQADGRSLSRRGLGSIEAHETIYILQAALRGFCKTLDQLSEKLQSRHSLEGKPS